MSIKRFFIISILLLSAAICHADEKMLFDFEDGGTSWNVPDWCYEKSDYVCKSASISQDVAQSGKSSLRLALDIPGSSWRAGIAECEECVLNLSDYDAISCSFYLPASAPAGLKAKLILTVEEGTDWKWTETANAIDLIPGKWVTMTADISPGSRDWMRLLGDAKDPYASGAEALQVDEEFRKSIMKVAVRIESDTASYKGPVYIDDIKAIK